MSASKQLRQEAARLRGQIERQARIVRRRNHSLMNQGRRVARHPAALPVAFICGVLAGRLDLADIKHLASRLTNEASALDIVSGLVSSTLR